MSCVVMRTNPRVCRGAQHLTNLISQRIRRDERKQLLIIAAAVVPVLNQIDV